MAEMITLYLDTDAEFRARRSPTGGRFKRSISNNNSKSSWQQQRCDFSSRNFVLELFNHCLELTRLKIASDLVHPVPQVGPLVMDVMEQRNTVIKQVRDGLKIGHVMALADLWLGLENIKR